ncbi:MAG TPA: hypothetical protein VM925_34340 [Labilithrix sp.]|jgi:hypothetical protein|nr:hypothetical protein [Labilithrix sp.]
MSTINRIVLCDSRGEELFSGSSLLSDPPPPPTLRLGEIERETCDTPEQQTDDEDEPIPETLRSSVHARIGEPVSRPIVVEEANLSAA